jgi:hypothetical protein
MNSGCQSPGSIATGTARQWAGVMADPTADLIRSGVYLNIGG